MSKKSLAKRLIALVLTLVLSMTFALPVLAADVPTLTVEVDGVEVVFDGQQPVNRNGAILVPVRGVFEQMGFAPAWNAATGVATLTSADTVVVITVGQAAFTVNGETVVAPLPAELLNYRVMLPVGAVAEALGATTRWESDTQTAHITFAPEEVPEVPVASDVAIFDVLDDVSLSIMGPEEMLDAVNAYANASIIREAAQAGEPVAQLVYGMMHFDHFGHQFDHNNFNFDIDTARYWLMQAFEGGVHRAASEIGFAYAIDGDYLTQREWLRIGADLGVAAAQFGVGGIYRWAAPQDHAMTVYWYRKAAEQGHLQSLADLGRFYAYGVGGLTQSYETAYEMFSVAARGGNSNGQLWLSMLYMGGVGVAQNTEQSLYWMARSIEQDDLGAMYELAKWYFYGIGVEQSYERALYYFSQVVDAGWFWTSAADYVELIEEQGVERPSPIYLHVGVEYTILPERFYHDHSIAWPDWPYVTEWHFVELHGDVNLDDFPPTGVPHDATSYYNVGSEMGDVFVLRWDSDNRAYLFIDLGDGEFNVTFLGYMSSIT